MGMRARPLSWSEADRAELERLSRSQTAPRRLVDRARIVLACLDGEPQVAIAARFGTRPNTVGKWRDRFSRLGPKGLEDAPRSGKPTVHVGLRERTLKMLEAPPPKGQPAWDGISLAKALGVSKTSVYAVLQKEGVQLQRTRSWCVSTDPEFATKAATIVGLYLKPPERALVISVDEKPNIQAPSRTTGYVRTSSGKAVRGLKSSYRRNGTLKLFAALNVATGEVIKKTAKTKTRMGFCAFMDEVVADQPEDAEIHVILDNDVNHKKNDEWLAAHPNVTFHFTPTSASWLNQIEIWFGILTRKALKGARFNNVQELAQAVDAFCDVWHEKAHPFVWRKPDARGSQIKNTIFNLSD